MFFEVDIRYCRAAAYQRRRRYTPYCFIRNSSIKCIHIRRLLNKLVHFTVRMYTCDDYDYYYYLLQLSCHSVAVVLTLVQTKQIRINVPKRNNKKHSTNSAKHSKYKYTYYQNTHTIVKIPPHSTKEVKTTTIQDTHQIK
jgi:hypothetical protein